MDAPSSPTALADAAGISVPYASQILNERRQPGRPLAIHIFRKTGWKAPIIAGLTDEQIDALETIDPWTRPAPAICGRCGERAEHPHVISCTSVHCPMRQREAA